uniref:hypothetical protein n=1 Tax=Amycolatopsis sp. CA-096443 TaxID=3239919 RepID=UPI003F4942B6
MVAALRKIARERDSIELADEIIAQVCAIVDAPDNASASDALCQLDAWGNDAVIQIATFGRVTCTWHRSSTRSIR